MDRRSSDPTRPRLGIDPVACDGIAICTHLAPRLIAADSWGYPILPRGPLHTRDVPSAAAAVAACPRRALFLEE